ncbi:MAG: hypothetical protein GXZ11_01890 [Tissierellia bacterium]|nr:hypothetical protein [Tissierellia bacterium]
MTLPGFMDSKKSKYLFSLFIIIFLCLIRYLLSKWIYAGLFSPLENSEAIYAKILRISYDLTFVIYAFIFFRNTSTPKLHKGNFIPVIISLLLALLPWIIYVLKIHPSSVENQPFVFNLLLAINHQRDILTTLSLVAFVSFLYSKECYSLHKTILKYIVLFYIPLFIFFLYHRYQSIILVQELGYNKFYYDSIKWIVLGNTLFGALIYFLGNCIKGIRFSLNTIPLVATIMFFLLGTLPMWGIKSPHLLTFISPKYIIGFAMYANNLFPILISIMTGRFLIETFASHDSA